MSVIRVEVTVQCDVCCVCSVTQIRGSELIKIDEQLPPGWRRSYGAEGRGRYHKCPNQACQDALIGR